MGKKTKKEINKSFIIGIIIGGIGFAISKDVKILGLAFVIGTIVSYLSIYFKKSLDKSDKIKKMEGIFPDFLQLMSSNLRAGMIVDKAMLISSRPEFSPLDEEIIKTGKEIATGINTEDALLHMSDRIGSEKISKTIHLIISGIRSGGDISILLENTAVSMREKGYLEQRAASSVMMYSIFIFLAVALFAPALFSLSTVLVDVLTSIMSGLPETDSAASSGMSFVMSSGDLPITFIRWFAVTFMLAIGIMASLILGLVNKGKEKEGLKYIPAISIISLGIFFISRTMLSKFLSGVL